jgi:CHAT domain-containing protein
VGHSKELRVDSSETRGESPGAGPSRLTMRLSDESCFFPHGSISLNKAKGCNLCKFAPSSRLAGRVRISNLGRILGISDGVDDDLTELQRLALSLFGAIGLTCAAFGWKTYQHERLNSESALAQLGGIPGCEARFTGGFPPSSSNDAVGKPTAIPPAVSGETVRLVRRIARKVERDRTPRGLADAAVLRLLLGRRDDALKQLRRAAESAPADADLMNDLLAAYLASYEVSHKPSELIAGLEIAERTRALHGAPAEALFNRALATEGLFLHEQARLSWARYLNADPNSLWADEARFHLARLEEDTERDLWPSVRDKLVQAAQAGVPAHVVEQLIGRFTQKARLWAEEELLPAWGRAWEKGDTASAVRNLRLARAIGVALADHHGERMVQDAVATVDAARGRSARLRILAQGHRAYAQGLELYRAAHDAEAMERFMNAAQQLASVASPYSRWARFRAILCAYYTGENRGVLSALSTLEREVSGRSYPSLRGRALLLQGMTHQRLAQMSDALRCYRLGLAAFTPTGETEHIAAAHLMIAENLRYQGDSEDAWKHRLEALALSHRIGGSLYYYNALRDGAEDLLRQGEIRTALALQNEMLIWSRRENDKLITIETLLARSKTQLRLRDARRATHDLDQAAEFLKEVPPGERRLRLATDLQLVRADLNLASAVTEQSISTAIVWATHRRDRFRLPNLFAKRAEARLSAGDLDSAASDLAAAIHESEQQRSEIDEEPFRVSYLDQNRPLYDQMIALQMQRMRPELAFEFAERVRARYLMERTRSGTVKPLVIPLRALTARMAPKTTLVEFAVLADHTIVWLIGRGDFEVVELPLGRAALEREVSQLRGHLGGGQKAALNRSIEVLSRDLLPRVLAHLPVGGRLVIVPDECLYFIPFSLLRHPVSGRYLIEEAILSYAPSAALYLQALDLERQKSEPPNSVLVLANPELDPAAFPSLRPLPGAVTEAANIAALYPVADVLSGRAATRAAFLASAPQYEIVHIAAHALPNFEYPLLSVLPLAPSAGEGNALYAHEIEHLDLHHTRLVVLGACSTALGRLSPSEGVFSFARSFLVAGVPAVIASLWSIDDRATESLLSEFHRRLRSGEDMAAALREAQLQFLYGNQAGESPTWAAFQIIGGTEPATTH